MFDENIQGNPIDGLGFVDFQFVPHLNNDFFPKIKKENIINAIKNFKQTDGKKLYIMDDNSAIFHLSNP